MQGASNQKDSKKKRKYSHDSSSLDYLNDEQEIQDSKMDAQASSRKRERSWMAEDNLRKISINNNRKEKYVQQDIQGIFLYKPGVQLPSLFQFSNQIIKVIIASEYISKDNPEIIKRNINGTDSYTSNSDLLCIAVHSGIINMNAFNFKKYEGVQVHYKVIKPKKNYLGSLRNGIISRSLKVYNGNALKPESQKPLINLPPLQLLQRYASNMHIPIGKNRSRAISRNIKNLIPIPQTHLTFNMNNEPAYKYCLINIADKGYNRSQFLTAKLDDLVLYLETNKQQKYQIAKLIQNQFFWVYRASKIKQPLKKDNLFFQSSSVPLAESDIEIMFKGLEWDQISWGNQTVQVKDQRIQGIKSFKFYQKKKELA